MRWIVSRSLSWPLVNDDSSSLFQHFAVAAAYFGVKKNRHRRSVVPLPTSRPTRSLFSPLSKMALVQRPGGMLRRVAVLLALYGCYCSVNTIVEGGTAVARNGSKKRRKQPPREQQEKQQRQSSSFSIGSSSIIHGGISLADRWRELRHEHHHKQSTTKTTNDRVAVDVTEFRDDGFLLYLQRYEEEEEKKRTAARTRLVLLEQRRHQRGRRKLVLRTIVGSALVVGAATWFWTTGGGQLGGSTETALFAQSLWMDLKRTAGAAIAVNLVGAMYRQFFFRSGSGATRAAQMQNKSKMDNPWIWLLVVTTSMTRPDLWFHVLWGTVLPTTARTFRHMLVAELWNRAFARFFALAGPVLVAALVGNNDHHDDNEEQQGGQPQQDHALLVWMEQDRSFVAMAIKRGTKKLFQSVLQKHMSRAVLYVWDRATEAIQGVVQQLFPSVAVVV
jgi:hypothetical protein